ncbi:MAG TPA: hypothetical protein VE569_12170 [Acidimicrobiia bacterium]|nr:hypothetical protein [Acidimicrobiia bacterium]
MSLAPKSLGDLIDDPWWMPSLLLLWIGLVAVPWALTSLQAPQHLVVIAAAGGVWLVDIAASALSGYGSWLRAGSLAAAVVVVGIWFLVWLDEGLYPIAGLPLFGAWNSETWQVFGTSFVVGIAGAVCVKPPTSSARITRIGVVSLFAVATLLVPWWWLPTSDLAWAFLVTTVGLAAVAAADMVSVWRAKLGRRRDLSLIAVTLLGLVSSLFAAGVFWRVWNGNFTPFPFQEVTTDLGKAVTLGSVVAATVLVAAIARRLEGSNSTHRPASRSGGTVASQDGNNG